MQMAGMIFQTHSRKDDSYNGTDLGNNCCADFIVDMINIE